jgi:hypothetical protein
MRKDYQKQLEYQRAWYSRNAEKARAWNKSRRIKMHDWWIEFKKTLSCKICGESHPACLDFHHKDPNEKEINIGNVLSLGWSKDRILKEITKCDVLCANCHRKHHWDERHPV